MVKVYVILRRGACFTEEGLARSGKILALSLANREVVLASRQPAAAAPSPTLTQWHILQHTNQQNSAHMNSH